MENTLKNELDRLERWFVEERTKILAMPHDGCLDGIRSQKRAKLAEQFFNKKQKILSKYQDIVTN